jgi:hypothetical protein
MLGGWPARRDRVLVHAMRSGAGSPEVAMPARELFAQAEAHGLADVLFDVWDRPGAPLEDDLRDVLTRRRRAREIDHHAHLAMLARIDEVLAQRGIRAVALKGVLLAERIYPRPPARGTTDIDLLVAEGDLERASETLRDVGYEPSRAKSEVRFRREHHHITLLHAHAPPLELHFHAIRAFGGTLRSEPLIERSIGFRDLRAVRVLSPPDELVYLVLHAAWHRFGRLGWLHDVALLIGTMTDDELREAHRRANAEGFGRVLAYAAALLERTSSVPRGRLDLLGHLGSARTSLVAGVTAEPRVGLLRSATRFLYAASLCDSLPHAARYAHHASKSYAQRLLGADS